MQLSQILKNKDWRMAIDPNIVSNNWFLNPRNQKRFGNNGHYLWFIGFCSTIIEMIVYISFHFANEWIISNAIWVGVSLLKIFAGCIIFWHYGKFKNYDIFGIRRQMKSVVITGTIFSIMTILVNSTLFLLELFNYYLIVHINNAIFILTLMYIEIPHVLNDQKAKYHPVNYKNRYKQQNFQRPLSRLKGTPKPKPNTNTQGMQPPSGSVTPYNDNDDHDHVGNSRLESTPEAPVTIDINVNNDHDDDKNHTIATKKQVFKNIDKMRYWWQAVSTAYNYELFVNFSQLEFSVENLLFITEVSCGFF